MASGALFGTSSRTRGVEIPVRNLGNSEFYCPSPVEEDGKFLLNNGMTVSVVAGDITKVKAGGVVVGEDKSFSGSGAVAKLFLEAGGEMYRQLRNQVKAMVSRDGANFTVYRSQGGPNLTFTDVFHAIIDHSMKIIEFVWKTHLENLFNDVSHYADEAKVTTLATPLLGAGKAGGNMETSLEAAVRGLGKVTPKVLNEVIIVEYDEEKAAEMKQKLKRIVASISEGSGSGSASERGGRISGEGPFKSMTTSTQGRGGSTSREEAPGSEQGARERVLQIQRAKISGSDSSAPHQDEDIQGRNGSFRQSSHAAAVGPTATPTQNEKIYIESYNTFSNLGRILNDTRENTTQSNATDDPSAGDGFFNKNSTGRFEGSSVQRPGGEESQRGARNTFHPGGKRTWENDSEPEQREKIYENEGDFQHDEGEDKRRSPDQKEMEQRDAFRFRDGSDGGENGNDLGIYRGNLQSQNAEEKEGDEDESSTHQADACGTTPVNVVYSEKEEEEDDDSTADQQSPNSDPNDRTKHVQKTFGNFSRKEEDPTPVCRSPDLSKQSGPPKVTMWSSSNLPTSQDDTSATAPEGTGTEHPIRASGEIAESAEEEATTDETRPPMAESDLNVERNATRRLPETQDVAWKGREPQNENADVGCNHPRQEKIASRHERSFQNISRRSEIAFQAGSGSIGGGNDPEGKMVVTEKPNPQLDGFPDCGTILIEYSFPNGTQGPQHPAPGQPYKGTFRRAFLPDNQEGQRVVGLLKKAFERKLTFHLERSGANGEWIVEFADIPHKTSLRGGPQGNGYPDDRYLAEVLEKLECLDQH